MTKTAIAEETSEEMVRIGPMLVKKRVLWDYQAEIATAVALMGTDPRIGEVRDAGPLMRRARERLKNLAALLAVAAGNGGTE